MLVVPEPPKSQLDDVGALPETNRSAVLGMLRRPCSSWGVRGGFPGAGLGVSPGCREGGEGAVHVWVAVSRGCGQRPGGSPEGRLGGSHVQSQDSEQGDV